MKAPYGSWKSPLTTELISGRAVSLCAPRAAREGDVYWLEGRPLEHGRMVLVRRAPDGTIEEVTPRDSSVRTRVHEYGGGAYFLHERTSFFVNFTDQRLYRRDPGNAPRPITPEPERAAAWRYADGVVTPDGRSIICVREIHPESGEPRNELVILPADGSSEPHPIAQGSDFYSFPRLSPDGSRLAWTEWNHPRMPWDGTSLLVAELRRDGTIRDPRGVAGGPEESIFQPQWSPRGVLHFVSDRTGWWNLYRLEDRGVVPVAPMESEWGAPQWIFGASTYTFLAGGRIAGIHVRDGREALVIISADGRIRPVDTPYSSFGSIPELFGDGRDALVFIAGSPSRPESVNLLDTSSGRILVLRVKLELPGDARALSVPRALEYPSAGGRTAFAFFYPPANEDYEPPEDEKPPLIVMTHGGPTGSTTSMLHPGIQFWTSRGFGVVDVDYAGSTGHGRAYRERLEGRWGIADTEDVVHAALHLRDRGEVDGRRMAIRGGSAGGYTTLCALVFYDLFSAGASYYGVADLEALVRDTHKFESRYLDGLVGPYPEKAEVYRARSPIHHAERLSCPVILFQGLEDRVVPPSQAEVMVEALRRKKLPFAYLAFAGEQHGFRRAETVRRALEAELYFYAKIFRFEPADPLEPIEIENLR